MRLRLLFVIPLFVVAVSGCGPLTYQQLHPRPNVALVGYEDKTISLAFGAQLQDSFETESARPCRGVIVSEWKATLKNGFNSAVSEAFKVTDEKGDYTLTITTAEPSLTPAAVNAAGGVVACQFVVRYKAVLEGPDGKKAQSGEAASKVRAGARPEALASAIEVMYEEIGGKLLAK